MNHTNGTKGVASHNFCFKYLSINSTFRPSYWRSAVSNLRFFDPQVEALCGDKRRLFLGEGETKIFLNFLIAVEFLLLTVSLIFWDIAWLRWLFKSSRLPPPRVLVKYINIGAQSLGSDPRAGQIRHSVASSSLPSFRGFLGVEAVLDGR